MKTKLGEAQSFYETVVLTAEQDDCLLWPFARTAYGYGRIRYNGKFQTVHRLVCIATYGKPPTPKHHAAHSCGHGAQGCVNKRHLRWATAKENAADKVLHGTVAHVRGERHGSAKLTQQQVAEIRAIKRVPTGQRNQHGPFLSPTQAQIAAQFGVGQTQIRRILDGKHW